jgi:DNA invertase Pin-like site-specific DNA recombinase
MSKIKAVAYLRTSSATNVGADKDSDKRQREAIGRCAKTFGYDIVQEFCDPGVSGKDAIEIRPGFSALLDRIESNGVRTVLVEDASRFARDLTTQELGIVALIARGVKVITANGDDLTVTDDPMKVAMRQIAGTFAQLEKARLVSKLKAARDRKKAATGKCEGRKSTKQLNPDLVATVKKMRRYKKLSLREVSAALAEQGFLNERGKPYAAQSIKDMLEA